MFCSSFYSTQFSYPSLFPKPKTNTSKYFKKNMQLFMSKVYIYEKNTNQKIYCSGNLFSRNDKIAKTARSDFEFLTTHVYFALQTYARTHTSKTARSFGLRVRLLFEVIDSKRYELFAKGELFADIRVAGCVRNLQPAAQLENSKTLLGLHDAE